MSDEPSSKTSDTNPASSGNDMVYDAVTEADLDESLQMLYTRAGQVNAVFACFGSAAQRAQHFELAFAEFLLDYNRITKRAVTLHDLETLDQRLRKRTLGTLLREFSKYVTIQDSKVVDFLETALEKRNFLMHHFFREREGKLRLQTDRMDLLSELTGIDHLLENAGTLIRAMRIAVSRATSGHGQSGDRSQNDEGENSRVLFTAELKMPNDLEGNNT
jgi:hypothetical protein